MERECEDVSSHLASTSAAQKVQETCLLGRQGQYWERIDRPMVKITWTNFSRGRACPGNLAKPIVLAQGSELDPVDLSCKGKLVLEFLVVWVM